MPHTNQGNAGQLSKVRGSLKNVNGVVDCGPAHGLELTLPGEKSLGSVALVRETRASREVAR